MKVLKSIVLFLFVLISLCASAQENDVNTISKFSLGVTYEPSYGYRYSKSSSEYDWMKITMDSIEIPRFNFSTGINFQVDLSKRFSLCSGILFSKKGYNSIENKFLNTSQISSNFYFISIPIRINVTLLNNKHRMYISTGVSNSILMKSNQIHVNTDQTVSKTFNSTTDLSNYNAAILAGLGVDLKITEKSMFKIEANYQQAINSISNTPLKRYFYSIGSTVGLFVKI